MPRSTVRIEINSAGVGQLLKSGAVLRDLRRRAQAIAGRAGEGMEVDSRIGATRARASVITATSAARRAEARDRRLTKAIDAGRG